MDADGDAASQMSAGLMGYNWGICLLCDFFFEATYSSTFAWRISKEHKYICLLVLIINGWSNLSIFFFSSERLKWL